jgi:hypothetical protein
MDKKKPLAVAIGAALGVGVARLADIALISGLLATAGGAVTFAGYMTMRGGQTPLINGMQYLAIFAQPSHPAPDAGAVAPRNLDMNPVGAIPREAKDEAKIVAGGYALVGAKPTYAWLRQGNRIFAVRPGDDVPSLGHVAGIEQRDGRWTLVDDKGATLIVSALAELGPTQGGKFKKRMIFGEDR